MKIFLSRVVPGCTVFAILTASATAQDQAPPVRTLETILVEADPVARDSEVATKTDTPLIETPRSISVITDETIAVRQVENIDEVLRYVAGVATEFRGIDKSRTDISIRGFNWSGFVFTDGMRSGVSNYAEHDLDAYALERVEVLRGPASILYGATSPGGVVNVVTKRPTAENFMEFGVDAGSFDQFGGRLDVGGAFDAAANFRGRLVALYHDGESQVRHADESRLYVGPSVSWVPSDTTSLTLNANLQRDEGPWAIFLPAVGTVYDNPNGQIPSDTQLGEPGFYDHFEREFRSAGWLFSHEFDNGWTLRQNLRSTLYDFDARSVSGGALGEDLRTIQREPWRGKEAGRSLTTDTSVVGKVDWGATRHTLLFGVDYRNSRSHSNNAYTADPEWAVDIFSTDYPFEDFASLDIPPYVLVDEDMYQAGAYFQDQLRAGRWAVSFGGRLDRAHIRTEDQLTESVDAQTKQEFTGQAGVVYLFDNGWAPYASYAESFEPTAGTNRFGEQFKPTTGTQYEAGVKYQPEGASYLVTFAAFQITQQNVLGTDPVDPDFYSQTGEVRSRGAEIEAKYRFDGGFELMANYSYTHARVTESTDGNVGFPAAQVPDHTATAWVDWPVAGTGLVFDAGVRYLSSRMDYANVIEVPSTTLVDAGVRYEFGGAFEGVEINLSASNLFDEQYVASCEGEYWCMWGPRRIVTASVLFRK